MVASLFARLSFAHPQRNRCTADLRLRPAASAIALAVCGIAGAILGVIVGVLCAGPLEGLLLGAAIGWFSASFADTVAAAKERRLSARHRSLEAELLAEAETLRAIEVSQRADPDAIRNLNRMWNM